MKQCQFLGNNRAPFRLVVIALMCLGVTTSEKISPQLRARIFKDYRPPMKGERYLTDRQLSKQLHVSRHALQDWRNTSKIGYVMLGGKTLCREPDIEKLLEENYTGEW